MYKGYKHTEEWKSNMSRIQKGRKHSAEHIKHLARALTGLKRSEEAKKNISNAHKGIKQSEESKRRRSKTLKGHIGYWKGKKKPPLSEEHKKHLSEALKGRYFTEEHKRKISTANTGKRRSKESVDKQRGEKCHFWQGGIWHNPYSENWTQTLKRSIRQRDLYTCQICGKEPAIYVHHIDYNKENCDPKNLITLCMSCHSKTNVNREYWKNYFNKEVMK